MTKDLLKLSILPILAIIIYICCNYLFNSLFGFSDQTNWMVYQPHFVNPINFLGSYINFYTIIFSLLPIFAIVLLFTMQYSLTSINNNSILYVVIVTVITFIIIKLLFSFILPISYLLKMSSEYDDFSLMYLLVQLRSAALIVIFITSLGLISHFSLKIINIAANPLKISAKANSYLIASAYSLLIVVTSLTFARYSMTLYQLDSFIYSTIAAAISFIYLYSWTYQHLKTHFNSECYASNTIKAYIITTICYLALSAIFFTIIFITKNYLSYRTLRWIGAFIHNTYILFIIACYVIAVIFIINLASKVHSKFYKIFHYLFFSAITLLLIYMAIMFKVGIDGFLIIYGIVIFTLTLGLWISYLFTKFALNKSFR